MASRIQAGFYRTLRLDATPEVVYFNPETHAEDNAGLEPIQPNLVEYPPKNQPSRFLSEYDRLLIEKGHEL
jgi:hypothetical protein